MRKWKWSQRLVFLVLRLGALGVAGELRNASEDRVDATFRYKIIA